MEPARLLDRETIIENIKQSNYFLRLAPAQQAEELEGIEAMSRGALVLYCERNLNNHATAE